LEILISKESASLGKARGAYLRKKFLGKVLPEYMHQEQTSFIWLMKGKK
jgi:hypothetical protein